MIIIIILKQNDDEKKNYGKEKEKKKNMANGLARIIIVGSALFAGRWILTPSGRYYGRAVYGQVCLIWLGQLF